MIKYLQLKKGCIAILVMLISTLGMAQTPAFPGAEGFGAYTTGGRGGKVIEVTNLYDAGTGSLRAAIQASGKRTVVFRVSGTINLRSTLKISNSDITIAGQTAPGDGITLRNYPLQVAADNVIIRFIRSRMGDTAETSDDAMNGRYNKNTILDHCTLSWSTDECGSFYDNDNFTMQYCLLSESLYASVHDKGNHGYGGIWGGRGASFHHNLLAHHTSRNPRFNGARYHKDFEAEKVDYRNNVVYNWGFNSAYAGEGGYINLVGNYYKKGPATNSGVSYRLFKPDRYDNDADPEHDGKYAYLYVEGNVMTGAVYATQDNWKYAIQGPTTAEKEEMKLDTPFEAPEITSHTAYEAYEHVLANVGVVVPNRDEIDQRIINETINGTASFGGAYGTAKGIIDTQSTVGGWPALETGDAPVDTDKDGIPDDWEDANSLNKNDATDRNTTNAEGYTMLEVYLNSLVEAYEYLIRPVSIKATETENKEATITWVDISDEETGFVIERKDGDVWNFVAQTAANDTFYVDNTIPEYGYTYYRIKAVNDELESYYTESARVRLRETTAVNSIEIYSLSISPNPVSSTGTIQYTLEDQANVSISVIDMFGRSVMTVLNESQSAGSYRPVFSVDDLAAGVYFVKVETASEVRVKRFVVSK